MEAQLVVVVSLVEVLVGWLDGGRLDDVDSVLLKEGMEPGRLFVEPSGFDLSRTVVQQD